jgi:hypothetical protein
LNDGLDMPDIERLTRQIELDYATTTERKAYIQGYHAGLDKARYEVAFIAVVIAMLFVIAKYA